MPDKTMALMPNHTEDAKDRMPDQTEVQTARMPERTEVMTFRTAWMPDEMRD